MIKRKSRREIEKMHEAGKLLASVHERLRSFIKPGVTTMEIEQFVEKYLAEHGATGEQKGYQGYEFTTCASINDEICHGFPRTEKLNAGDIVTIDMVVNLNGYLADSAWTHAVGEISEDARKLMDVTKTSLYKGIEQAVPGNRIGDIGHAIQSYAEGEGYSVVRDFTGHGIGESIHEDPYILTSGLPVKGHV